MLTMVEVRDFQGGCAFLSGFFAGEFVVNGWWNVVS
jgi:hypothetical protein